MLMATLQDREAEGELRRERITELRRQRAQEAALGQALQGLDFTKGPTQPGMAEVAKADPNKALAVVNMLGARQEALRKSALDNPKLYEFGVQQLQALKGNPQAAMLYPKLRAGLVQSVPLLELVLPSEYDEGFTDRASAAVMRMKGHGLPQFKTGQVGETEVGGVFDPLAPPDKSFSLIPGLGGPKHKEDKILYIDPDNSARWAYGDKNSPPFPGAVPKDAAALGISTPEGATLMNAKAWILGAKSMTSFRGLEKGKVADMAYNAGFDTQDIASIQSNYKALNTAKTRLAGQQALIEAFTNNARLNIDLGNKLSEGVDRFGSPAANAWLQWFQGKIMGQEVPMNQDVKAFQAIVGPTANEWAKVMTSATGAGGVVSDTARKEVWDLLNTTLNKSQFKNVGAVMQMELENRAKGINMEHQRIQNDINTVTKYVDDKFSTAFPHLVKENKVQRPDIIGGGKKGGETNKLSSEERQAYDTKLSQVKAMSESPQKQKLLQQMQELGKKWGIE
jgi:hypothetical protein